MKRIVCTYDRIIFLSCIRDNAGGRVMQLEESIDNSERPVWLYEVLARSGIDKGRVQSEHYRTLR